MFHPSTCQNKQNSVMTSGEALADSIIVKKNRQPPLSGDGVLAFSGNKGAVKLFFFLFLDVRCCLPVPNCNK